MKARFYIFLICIVSTSVAIPQQWKSDEGKIHTTDGISTDSRTNESDCNKNFSKKADEKEKPATEESKDSRKQTVEPGRDRGLHPKKARKQKAFFLNYRLPQVQQYPESDVYYIKLPPTPYVFVPGFGYVPQTPSFSFPTSKKPLKQHFNYEKPLVRVPIDFVSNGKPTTVYRYPNIAGQSQVVTLDKGPYSFNGNPVSFYLLGSNGAYTHQAFSYSNLPENYFR